MENNVIEFMTIPEMIVKLNGIRIIFILHADYVYLLLLNFKEIQSWSKTVPKFNIVVLVS